MASSISQTGSYMLAKHVPSLRSTDLCDFLKQLDAQEEPELERENKRFAEENDRLNLELSKLRNKHSWKIILKEVPTPTLLVGVIATAVSMLIGEKMENEQTKKSTALEVLSWVVLKGMARENIAKSSIRGAKPAIAWGCAVICFQLIMFKIELQKKQKESSRLKLSCTTEINQNRRSRLQVKIKRIAERILQPEDRLESIQLPIAKDFFSERQVELTR